MAKKYTVFVVDQWSAPKKLKSFKKKKKAKNYIKKITAGNVMDWYESHFIRENK